MGSRSRNKKLRVGQTVVVYSVPLSGLPFVEGRATIVGRRQGKTGPYPVRFPNDGNRIQLRFIHAGDPQTSPQHFLRMLLDYFRASVDPTVLKLPPPSRRRQS